MRIGIDLNSEQRIISGARVAFDARTIVEVEKTRDPENRKPRGLRTSSRGFTDTEASKR